MIDDSLNSRFDAAGCIRSFWASLPVDRFARNNAISAFLAGFLPAVFGSAISVWLIICFGWGVISLLFGRFEFKMTRSDKALAWSFTAFVGLEFFTALIGENPGNAFRSIVWLTPFLALWVIIPRLRAREGVDHLRFYMIGAGFGLLAALIIALAQTTIGIRAEGGAGNSAVFAMVCLCLTGIVGMSGHPDKRHSWLVVSAIVAGALCIILSLTRGVAMAAFPVAILLIAYAPHKWHSMLKHRSALAICLAAAVTLVAFGNVIVGRFRETILEFQMVAMGGDSASVGERLRLWSAAWDAIVVSPIFGYGVQNRMAVLNSNLISDQLAIHSFTHAHNAFLSFALDGGMVVLLAVIGVLVMPGVIAWKAKRDAAWRQRLFVAAVVPATYAMCGMTQIMFKHDIMDSFYIFFAIIVAASIPDTTGDAGALSHRSG